MPKFASITLTGHLGRDPEIRYTKNGTAVANATVAVETGHGDRKLTSWYRLTLWGKQADTVNELWHKGLCVTVTGEPSVHEFESDGNRQKVVEVNVDRWSYGDSKKEDASPTTTTPKPSQDDDIPF